MDIGDHLTAVATSYSVASMKSPGHAQLAKSKHYLQPLIPAGLQVRFGGGQATPTFTPWIGILDPDETDSPLRGIYLVYIFKKDLKSVVLTLNQGATSLVRKLGALGARKALASDSAAIRSALEDLDTADLEIDVEFGWNGGSPKNYTAGNIVGRTYSIASLPEEDQLEADLERFLILYQRAIVAKRSILQSDPGAIQSPSSMVTNHDEDPLANFRPKSDGEYVQHLLGRSLVKSRRHEALVRDYGLYAHGLGYVPATTVHPRDLVLTGNNQTWLVEAKVLYGGNATNAVREALGQLATYSYFLYDLKKPSMLALFTEPIGDAYVDFLESAGIASVWKGSLTWEGSTSAAAAGLF